MNTPLNRLRRVHWATIASSLALLHAGCANSGLGQPRVMPGARTVATVGNRPVSVTAGSPGKSASSGPIIVDGNQRADSRVTGRVVDENGRPVANAEVRLADGSSDSGRLIRTLTDDAGGFTLNGLRPGSHYTLIAQGNQRGQSVAGRASVDVPGSRIEIEARPRSSSSVARSRQVEPVSQRSDDDSRYDDMFDSESKPRSSSRPAINEDDLPEPSDTSDLAKPAAAWRAARDVSQRAATESSAASIETARSAEPLLHQDEINPLPPALERTEGDPPAVTSHGDLDPLATPTRSNANEPARQPEIFTSGEGPIVSDFPASPAPRPLSQPSAEPSPNPLPDGPFPARDESAFNPPASPAEPAPPRIEPEVTTTPASDANVVPSDREVAAPPLANPAPPASETPQAQITPRKRPTWNDLEAQHAARAANPATRSVRRTGYQPETAPAPTSARPLVSAACRYDSRAKRIVDFRLTGIDGAPVQFHEIQADYILLDFWGTWCGPCIKSIPKLVEIQKRFDSSRIQVIGIAYEQGPLEDRAAGVRRVAEKLGINYPLLMAEADGKPCPLADALNVQHYPTMILLDRNGRVVWRESGASDVAFARLDRVLAATTTARR